MESYQDEDTSLNTAMNSANSGTISENPHQQNPVILGIRSLDSAMHARKTILQQK